MTEVDRTIRVRASSDTVFREWLRFSAFPHFDLEAPSEWDGERTIRWSRDGEPGRARITELRPDHRVAWTIEEPGGTPLRSGVATFTPTTEQGTEVSLHVEYEPRGAGETVRSLIGAIDTRIEELLDRFRDQIEAPSQSPGADAPGKDPIDELSDIADRTRIPYDEWRGVGRRSETGFDTD